MSISKTSSSIKDVAKRASVSTATVSHVINETRYVSEETKKKVHQAMKELNYQPNQMAQGLRSRKSKTVGLIVPMLYTDTSNFFFMSIANGIETILQDRGYHLILSNSHEELKREMEHIKVFNSKLIDGLIIAPTAEDFSQYEDVLSSDYPVVFIDRKPRGFCKDGVFVDSEKGTYEAINTLIEKGHKRIAFLTGSLGITTSDDRLMGYKRAFKDHNLKINLNLIAEGEASFQAGYKLAKELVEEEKVTALFVANNVMTMGALGYLNEQKIKVPEEVAIIGFDDYDWMKITTPPLAVVKQPSFEIGEQAVNLLLKRIEEQNQGEPEQILLSTEFVIRESI
ncbi:LacI family transcriptional regulator [Bacillus sp. LL01]|uniref:LacI family DNA-binding transcriptional regulator n=1 Tax=Bacillus sp. LL01 TaxID=1665556 RepID=UPI00064D26FB|nr:LacI family DNA-binding transcriptional regulator [Bacillus sp. LL01]KMJ55839.1 LacI family transcriptional regulator [Bacillus sp. LL01]